MEEGAQEPRVQAAARNRREADSPRVLLEEAALRHLTLAQ